ncbi:Txe/YoeB family addiction module toxin [Candidatus Paracaedibacter symbiosus]|uniref:Txe/YoeB family addiction module toxin n=1 Tax=Candidatus Paracaedibacter symbiosus TaxID=244582 RepID=UPI000509EDB9|nr:Txe/YoeB family addiction module toxin [Candidatus Paracaedibacter symbiosus]
MNLLFLEEAWEDYQYWLQTDKVTLKRINLLIKDCTRAPYSGIGKPEPLKFDLTGTWSRRINQEHRLVYKVEDDNLIIIQCRYHY